MVSGEELPVDSRWIHQEKQKNHTKTRNTQVHRLELEFLAQRLREVKRFREIVNKLNQAVYLKKKRIIINQIKTLQKQILFLFLTMNLEMLK